MSSIAFFSDAAAKMVMLPGWAHAGAAQITAAIAQTAQSNRNRLIMAVSEAASRETPTSIRERIEMNLPGTAVPGLRRTSSAPSLTLASGQAGARACWDHEIGPRGIPASSHLPL